MKQLEQLKGFKASFKAFANTKNNFHKVIITDLRTNKKQTIIINPSGYDFGLHGRQEVARRTLELQGIIIENYIYVDKTEEIIFICKFENNLITK